MRHTIQDIKRLAYSIENHDGIDQAWEDNYNVREVKDMAHAIQECAEKLESIREEIEYFSS